MDLIPNIFVSLRDIVFCFDTNDIFSGVTILLSLTVFLNIVTENIPETSDAVPLICM